MPLELEPEEDPIEIAPFIMCIIVVLFL